jgi:hypothetical protein
MPTESEKRESEEDIAAKESQRLAEIARRHGFSSQAVFVLLSALQAGSGKMAQFNHPELGGLGQWNNGMIMIGDFSNNALKERVLALCNELASFCNLTATTAVAGSTSDVFDSHSAPGQQSWWPPELGTPSTTGAQNEICYAYFPDTCRLAIKEDSHVTIFDTGDHKIFGVSQQQGKNKSLTFTSQHGLVESKNLKIVGPT